MIQAVRCTSCFVKSLHTPLARCMSNWYQYPVYHTHRIGPKQTPLNIRCAPLKYLFGESQIIDEMMDIRTIEKKLKGKGGRGYDKHEKFSADVRLVFENAIAYKTKMVNKQEVLLGAMGVVVSMMSVIWCRACCYRGCFCEYCGCYRWCFVVTSTDGVIWRLFGLLPKP